METEIDLAAFQARVIDGTYIVLWDVTQGQWRRFYTVDGKTAYLLELAVLTDPAGSEPPVELVRTHAQRLKAETSGMVTIGSVRPVIPVSRSRNCVCRDG